MIQSGRPGGSDGIWLTKGRGQEGISFASVRSLRLSRVPASRSYGKRAREAKGKGRGLNRSRALKGSRGRPFFLWPTACPAGQGWRPSQAMLREGARTGGGGERLVGKWGVAGGGGKTPPERPKRRPG